MTTQSLAIRLATGIAGSVALFSAAAPAFAYYYNNGSAYCSDRYNPNCIEQTWGPGYFAPYNTNYNSWYMNSANYPYYDHAYGYPYNSNYSYSYSCSYNGYNCGYNSYSSPTYYNNYPMYYSTPNYSYQYQYQYQYQYSY